MGREPQVPVLVTLARRSPARYGLTLLLTLVVCLLVALPVLAEGWSHYGATKGGTKYSALAEITPANVADLEVAWVYRTGEAQRHADQMPKSAFQNTPILLDGSLIVCTQFYRVVALDPATGDERWVFEPNVTLDYEIPLSFKCRGVSWWLDEAAEEGEVCRRRILLTTPDLRLIAIDARNGEPCPGFGNKGEVTVRPESELLFPGEMQLSSPPSVVGGVVVVGSFIADNVRADAPSGVVRAFDVRTGAHRWTFDPVPRDPDDPMQGTWGRVAEATGAANVWTMMSVDEERGLVFLPTSSPSNDFYGGQRPGENRYANSVVALRGATGEIVWHYQLVHHDLWDFDLPAQPILVDLERDGETVPALLQTTKQGFVFAFNRETGEPLTPIEERPVPQDGVEGEWLSPTQPFPVAPPPFVKQGISLEDAWGFTFVDRNICRDKIAALRQGGLYTPPSLEGTAMLPGFPGGGNWGGGAYDPDSGFLVVNSTRVPAFVQLLPKVKPDRLEDSTAKAAAGDEEQVASLAGSPYLLTAGFLLSPLGAPCTAPPWGGLTAIDINDGTIKWDVPLGSIHRMFPQPLPFNWNLGTPVAGGPIITGGGLVFVASAMDNMFRGMDLRTGEVLWRDDLPAGGQATPMTYEAGGRQFVVIAAGGHALFGTKLGDYVVAYALPEKRK